MSLLPQGRRIVWLVRILTFIGLAMVVTTTGLVGWTLSAMRRERTNATAEQDRLDAAARQFRERAGGSHAEIRAALDETITWQPPEHSAVAQFAALIRSQVESPVNPTVRLPLVELRDQCAGLTEIAERANAWRQSYLAVWNDLREQRTMNRVRQVIGQLRADMGALESGRRLDEAIAYKRWRHASGEEAARQARAILLEHARQQSEGGTDFDSQLAELARLVELLGGEEQYDSLTDLKDNKLRPVLDRLTRAVGAIVARGTNPNTLNPQAVEDLKTALFGEGSRTDEAHQTIVVGRGGLFALRRDALQLRREREDLKNELTALVPKLEAANASFANSTQLRSATLTRQMEQSLASGWNHMLLFGAGCAALFLWLAWRISRGIDGQVNAIERARAEAETSRQTTQQLMLEQQHAAAELAAAHGGLQASEQRFRMLSASAPVGIFETDPAGSLLYINQMWQTISGLALDEGLGDGWLRAVHPEDIGRISTEWRQAVGEARGSVSEFRFCRAGGEVRWVHGLSVPVHSESGAVIGHVGTIEDITERKHSDAKLEKTQKQLLETSRQAGMAEVATSVLHNVGNVLNSVNVASTCVATGLRKSKAASLTRVVAMLRENEADLSAFFATDARAKQLPGFLAQIADHLSAERASALGELAHLQKNIEHIKDIVAMQQTYAKVSGITETVQIAELIEDTLRMNAESFAHHQICVVREFAEVPPVTVEKHKVLQILVNLVRNAKHACDAGGQPEKTLTLRVFDGDGSVKIAVSDNGVGIPAENLTRIFNHGFTTKKDGHGFGLHSGALAAKEMGGALRVESNGAGEGATFTLELPLISGEQKTVKSRGNVPDSLV